MPDVSCPVPFPLFFPCVLWFGGITRLQVTEFDSPHALLSNPSSALCQLATSTGLASAQQLSSMAQAASEARATASPSKVRVRGEINTDAGADAQ